MTDAPSARSQTLNFITGNANKLAEVQAFFDAAGTGVKVQNKSLDIPELQGSIEFISRAKARSASSEIQKPVIVEDTCLIFDAWGELPGPYVKYFLESLGVEQFHKLLAGFEDKSATAVCTFAYCEAPGQEQLLFQGRTKGKIVPARGPTTFGWDACFEYEGQTYSEMTKAEKNKVSHRGKALEKLAAWLKETA